ncbi:EpsG family protein [Mediterranea massiliensis]|uniref:EpsG family protein n=1 Tax=Mediterranea massiliensis TaxID=1841865 RepID=UPI0025A354E4|nr:EpsG family protein [Mediterranea massiliensis]MDM8337652.1 EpsG family protein [Mediterranea massiliensis]
MIITIIIGLFSVFIAYLAKYHNFKYGLEVAFLVLTFFMSIRYEWGSDYPSYLSIFYRINENNIVIWGNNSILDGSELGWTLLNFLFYPFGFFGLVIFLTCLENFLIYSTIRRYVVRKWYWLAVFIYVFTSAFMLTGCSMMRQFLVMALFLYSIRYLFEKKILRFIGMIFLCMTVHATAIIIIPFLLLSFVLSKSSGIKFCLLFCGTVLFVFLFFKMFVVKYADYLLLFGGAKYEKYLGNESEGINSGLGLLFNFLMIVILSYKVRDLNKYYRNIMCLYSVYILFYPLYTIIPLTARLGYYFSFLSIVVFPCLLNKVKFDIVLLVFIILFMFYTVVSFLGFFASPIWHDSMYEYKTIFSAPYWM